MNASSDQRPSAFEGLRWANVRALVDLLCESNLQTSPHIEKRYRERGHHFSQTVTFLTRIGLMKQLKGMLSLQQQLFGTFDTNLHSVVLDRLVFSKNRYSSEIARYLAKYTITQGKVRYRSTERVRSMESAVRNFLMEMGVIVYVQEGDYYFVSPEHFNFCIQMRGKCMNRSPLRVTMELKARDQIGLAAEAAVFASEKERVGPRLSHCVRHVALSNAAAGYDILSVTAGTPPDMTPRYIEVKAVSAKSFQFYWTSNELQVAHLLGSLYYLYLVPAEADCEIRKDRFVIIPNPYSDVLDYGGRWVVESDVLLCRPEDVQFLRDQLLEV